MMNMNPFNRLLSAKSPSLAFGWGNEIRAPEKPINKENNVVDDARDFFWEESLDSMPTVESLYEEEEANSYWMSEDVDQVQLGDSDCGEEYCSKDAHDSGHESEGNYESEGEESDLEDEIWGKFVSWAWNQSEEVLDSEINIPIYASKGFQSVEIMRAAEDVYKFRM